MYTVIDATIGSARFQTLKTMSLLPYTLLLALLVLLAQGSAGSPTDLSMSAKLEAREENPVVFTLYDDNYCHGKKRDVTYQEYNAGLGNGCFITNGAYKSISYNQWEVHFFKGGACATEGAQSEPQKCNGFGGDLYISGVKWRV